MNTKWLALLLALAPLAVATSGCAEEKTHPHEISPNGVQPAHRLTCGDLVDPAVRFTFSSSGDLLADGEPASCGPDGIYCPPPDAGALPSSCDAGAGQRLSASVTCRESLWEVVCKLVDEGSDAGAEAPVDASAPDADEPDADAAD